MFPMVFYSYLSRQWLCFFDSHLFYVDNVHLVKKGNLKLAESMFSLIKNVDNVKRSSHGCAF